MCSHRPKSTNKFMNNNSTMHYSGENKYKNVPDDKSRRTIRRFLQKCQMYLRDFV